MYDGVLLSIAALFHLLIYAKPIEESQAVAENTNGTTKSSWLGTEFVDSACNIRFLLKSKGGYKASRSATNNDGLGHWLVVLLRLTGIG